MKKKPINLTPIREFFNTVTYDKSASQTEIYNFYKSLLSIVLQSNNIEENKYSISLHLIKKMTRDDEDAYMCQEEKDLSKFHIYLPKKSFKLKGNSNEDMEEFLYLTYVFLHECAHVVQYIKYQELMDDYDTTRNKADKLINSYIDSNNSLSDIKMVYRAYLKHVSAKNLISCVEKDANFQAYHMFKNILLCLIKTEHDINLKILYEDILIYIRKIRKDDFRDYRAERIANIQALQTLEKYGIHAENLITF